MKIHIENTLKNNLLCEQKFRGSRMGFASVGFDKVNTVEEAKLCSKCLTVYRRVKERIKVVTDKQELLNVITEYPGCVMAELAEGFSSPIDNNLEELIIEGKVRSVHVLDGHGKIEKIEYYAM